MAVGGGRRALIFGACAVLSTLPPLRPVPGQPAAGGFEDATLPRRGEVRIRLGATFDGIDDRFGSATGRTGRLPLGGVLSFDSLGLRQIPAVAQTDALLRDSLGVALGLSLGTVRTDSRVLVMRVPLRLEYGITSRLSVDALIPIVRTRNAVQLSVNADGGNGNLGFNPADARFGTPTGAAALNGAVQTQLGAAITALQGLLATCPTTAGSGTPVECGPVIANRAGAMRLVGEARTVGNGVAALYGNGAAAGAPFVPVAGTNAQRAVEARLDAIQRQFAAFNVGDLAAGTYPAAAQARIANTGFRRILADPGFGFAYDTTFSVTRAGTGDLELGGRYQWIDTFGGAGSGLRARSTVGLAYRVGTLGFDLPELLFDVPLGSAAGAVIAHGEGDVGLGRRFGATLAGRLVQPLADSPTLRVPTDAESILAPATTQRPVSRTLGREIAIEITPRWAPSRAVTVAGQFAFTTKQADDYPDAPILALGTAGHAQRAGFGITYSTLDARARGRTRLPIEVSFLHTATIAGSGGVVPRVTSDALVVRFYNQLVGAPRR